MCAWRGVYPHAAGVWESRYASCGGTGGQEPVRGCGAQAGSGKGEILTVKEAAPIGHVCSLHKELRSPLIPFRYGRTSSGGERMEVGKRRK